MSDAKSPPELSMDEILATIRRIIAEDEQPGGPLSARRATAGGAGTGTDTGVGTSGLSPSGSPAKGTAAADEILELTEALNEDGTVRHLAPIGGASRIAALREPAPAATLVEPEPQPQPTFAETPSPPPPPEQTGTPEQAAAPEQAATTDERLVSDWASTAAGAAFARLASAPREPGPKPELAPRAADRTLENIVRDLLRPVLQTWLDEHLPGIVEQLAKAEIARAGKPGPS
jgi:cell pole-organizing protein PopZ